MSNENRPARFRQAAARLGGDARGIVAVEFALIVPIVLLLLLGAIELTRAVSIDRRLTVVTNMVADLVAREEKLNADDVNAIYQIAELVMSPFDATPLKLSIIPVRSSMNDGNVTRVYPVVTDRPSYNGGPQLPRCESYSLARDFLKPGSSLIVVESSYAFTPMFGSFIMSGIDWKQAAYASPRQGCVEFYDKAKSESSREKVCVTSTCFSSSS